MRPAPVRVSSRVTQTTAHEPLVVHCLTKLDDLRRLRGEWDALLQEAESSSIFQTWEWVTTWYEHFGSDRAIFVLTVRDGQGRLVGLAPFSWSRRGGGRILHLLGFKHTLTEYFDATLHPDVADSAVDAIFEAWRRREADWDLLRMPLSEDAGPFIRNVRRLAARYGYRVYSETREGLSRPLPTSREAFHRSLKKSMKDNVNNYVNRLRREGHDERLVVVEDPAELDAALDTFFALHRDRAQADFRVHHHDEFTRPEIRGFLRTVARRLLERGKIWPCLLYVDGKPVAAQICLLHAGRIYFYFSGYDPAWARYGVMLVLNRRCIERAIDLGCRELDMLLTTHPMKTRWGCEPRPLADLTLASPRLRSRFWFGFYRLHRARARLGLRCTLWSRATLRAWKKDDAPLLPR